MAIIEILTQTIQSLGVILILGGMLLAFLWKAAAIVNFVFGFIITLIATYVAYTIGADLVGVGAVFLIGLMVTGVVAALGALTCVLEGFVLSALGFWGAFVASSPSSALSSGMIVGAVVASIISTAIAVFIGGRVISTSTFGAGKKPIKALFGKKGSSRYYRDRDYVAQRPAPIKVQVLPEKQIFQETGFPRRGTLLDREIYSKKKTKTLKLLDKLEEETTKGKISKTTSDKLRSEIEKEIVQINEEYAHGLKRECEEHTHESAEINAEILKLNCRISDLTEEKKQILAENAELEARFKIKQINRKDYRGRIKTHTEKLDQINNEILASNNKIQKLKERQEEVTEILANNQKESASADYGD